MTWIDAVVAYVIGTIIATDIIFCIIMVAAAIESEDFEDGRDNWS